MHVIGVPRTILQGGRLELRELSPEARGRLQAREVWQRSGIRQISLEVCGMSQATLYRWRRRYDPRDLTTLESRSRRPRRVRLPQTPPAVGERLRQLREQYPCWGREKLRVLLRREGVQISAQTSDRVLARVRRQGRLVEPPRHMISVRQRRRQRPYAIRKPMDSAATRPGDLVELDTLDVRPLPGVVLTHVPARDVVSRWEGLEVYRRATATTATHFLEALRERVPCPIRAIQVDGGSEVSRDCEEACRNRGIRLFALPPRSPTLNGHVERAQRTHTEEFSECYEGDCELAALRPALREWERTDNTVRPHQALGYLTPAEYLAHDTSRGP